MSPRHEGWMPVKCTLDFGLFVFVAEASLFAVTYFLSNGILVFPWEMTFESP